MPHPDSKPPPGAPASPTITDQPPPTESDGDARRLKLSLAPVDVLRRARVRLADPTQWTKGAPARSRHTRADGSLGFEVSPHDPAAMCWCALGAVRAEGGMEGGHAEDLLYKALPGGVDWDDDGSEPVADFNDHHATHGDVLALFDRAIALAEAA